MRKVLLHRMSWKAWGFSCFAALAILSMLACSRHAAKLVDAGGDAATSLHAANQNNAGNRPQDAGSETQSPAPSLDELTEILQSEFARLNIDPARAIAKAPAGEAGQVTDFTYDTGTHTLSWTYANLADYDSNREVGVPDITPIAQNYLETVSSDPDDPNAPIDGDGSGEIGVPDITPIAQNYLRVLTDYELQYSADGSDGSYTQLAVIGRDLGVQPAAGAFLKFTHELTWAANGFYRVVPHDAADDSYGIPSNTAEWQDGFVVTLSITLATAGVTGSGSADDPYELDAAQPFEFAALQGETDVTDQVAWTSSPEFAVSWSTTAPGSTESILDIAGDFYVYCTLGNETSNTIYCRKHMVGP